MADASGAVELRSYQNEACDRVRKMWDKGGRPILAVGTGLGKTVIMGSLARDAADHGGRTLLVAHREELLDQAAATFGRFGLSVSREQGPSTDDGTSDACVASVASLRQDKRLERIVESGFTHVFVDEAHHVRAASYEKVLGALSGAKQLGVTATPERSDKKSLGELFDGIAYNYGMKEGVEDGWLSPVSCLMLPLRIDITNAKVVAGDYTAESLGNEIDPYLEAVADQMLEQGCGTERKTVVFVPLVKTAKRLASILKAKGADAEWVSGSDADRSDKVAAFGARQGGIMCNCALLTEGWDCPDVSCIVVLRPTKSRSLYVQMVGRGTRPAEGKKDLLLLDFLWQTERHGICRPWTLRGASDEVEAAMEKAAMGGGRWDLMDLEEEAERQIVADRESALADQLLSYRDRDPRLVNPVEVASVLGDLGLYDYEPTFAWETEPPSPAQLDALKRMGVDADIIATRGLASKLMDLMVKRSKKGLATLKQVRTLRSKGFPDSHKWRFDEASAMIDRIAKNAWQVPRDVDVSLWEPPSLGGPREADERSTRNPDAPVRRPKFRDLARGQSLTISRVLDLMDQAGERPEGMDARAANDVLEDAGLLSLCSLSQFGVARPQRVPTEKGACAGISWSVRDGRDGDRYVLVTYDEGGACAARDAILAVGAKDAKEAPAAPDHGHGRSEPIGAVWNRLFGDGVGGHTRGLYMAHCDRGNVLQVYLDSDDAVRDASPDEALYVRRLQDAGADVQGVTFRLSRSASARF